MGDKLVQIKYVGDESYHSSDPWNDDANIDLHPGESDKVSEEKADQLAEDRPYDFEIGGKKAAAPAKGKGGKGKGDTPAEPAGDEQTAGDAEAPAEAAQA